MHGGAKSLNPAMHGGGVDPATWRCMAQGADVDPAMTGGGLRLPRRGSWRGMPACTKGPPTSFLIHSSHAPDPDTPRRPCRAPPPAAPPRPLPSSGRASLSAPGPDRAPAPAPAAPPRPRPVPARGAPAAPVRPAPGPSRPAHRGSSPKVIFLKKLLVTLLYNFLYSLILLAS